MSGCRVPSASRRAYSLSRRLLTRKLATVGLAMVAMPLSQHAIADGRPVYFTWTDYDNPGFFPDYVVKHGEPPLMQTFLDENEALSQLKSGLPVDVVHPCNGQVKGWRDAGVLQTIDPSRLSHWPDVFEPLKTISGAVIDGQQWFIPIDWGITSVAYRPDLVDISEESWSLLWDQRYAGRLAVGQDASDTVTIAGILAGARDPFAMTDDEFARAKELLVRQRPLISFYWNDQTTMEAALADGQIVASTAWPANVAKLKKLGVPIKYMNPKEGAIGYACGLVLARAATEVDAAYDLMNAMLAPEAGKWLVETLGYGHSNRKTFDIVDPRAWSDTGMPHDVVQLLNHGHFTHEYERYDVMQGILEQVMGTG